MKFTINSKALLSRLVAAGKAIPTRVTMQILSNFKFELEESTLTITASGNDNTVVSRIQVENAEGNGSVCIESKRVIELLKAMPDCPVTFSVEDVSIKIRYANGRYNLTGIEGNQYPLDNEVDTINVKAEFDMPASQVLNAMDKVAFAISSDELRPQMQGIFWDITPEAIVFVATDTRVLAKYRSTQTAPGVETSFILPGNSFSLLRAFLGKAANVKIRLTDRGVFIIGDDFSLRLALYNGKFPAYNRVIPQNNDITITVDRMDFTNAIQRVAICADTQSALLRLKIEDGTLNAVAQNIDNCIDGEERINCELNGKPMEIGFSAPYLKNILNAVSTQNIIIKLSDPSRPGIFVPSENDEFGELTLLCMPMCLQ